MIAYVTGKVMGIKEKSIIVLVGGIGLSVFLPTHQIARLEVGGSVSLFTYLAVKESALELYGFATQEDEEFFETLLTVSGIGPKGALGIVSLADTDDLKRAIATGDAGALTKVSGLGKKSAEKIVLELRDKFTATHSGGSKGFKIETDALLALEALGYHPSITRALVRSLATQHTDTSIIIKHALKELGKPN